MALRVLAVIGVSWLVACSSIPDVQFTDAPPDAGSDGSSASLGDGGNGSGTPDSSASGYSCPDNPPPFAKGVCCPGNHLCLKCTILSCDRCKSAGCDSGNVCCARSDTKIDCKKASSC